MNSPLRFFAFFFVFFLSLSCLPLEERACQTPADCKDLPAIFCIEPIALKACGPGDRCVCRSTECSPGKTRECYTGPAGTLGLGLCKAGLQSCLANGRWSACLGQILPTCEICDKQDNDCDGKVDNLPDPATAPISCKNPLHPDTFCRCPIPGSSRSCYSGDPKETLDSVCSPGLQYCDDDNRWGPCFDQILPQAEICDGLDNDCNGQIDDHLSCPCIPGSKRSCYSGDPKTPTLGLCKTGTHTCNPDESWGLCQDEIIPTSEICDGQDNDCDGKVDEACPCSTDADCDAPRLNPKDRSQASLRFFKACCGGICRDTLSDPSFCSPSQTCSNPATPPGPCQPSEICCQGSCIDPFSHPKHCGGCDSPCRLSTDPFSTDSDICLQGLCRPTDLCKPSSKPDEPQLRKCGANDPQSSKPSADCTGPNPNPNDCIPICADLRSNPKHCGGCNRVCHPQSEICLQGRCENRCGESQTLCNATTCADLRSDSAHCGSCFHRCPPQALCLASVCKDQGGEIVPAEPYEPSSPEPLPDAGAP